MEISLQSREMWQINGMHNPFLMKGMEKAIERLVKAINEREKIVIYGYYDLDSITGISLLLLVLKYFNADVEYFIPDEKNEKRIISNESITNHIKLLGTSLIITIGCSVESVSQLELCHKQGMDIIITDFRKTVQELSDALMINPKMENSKYPFKELTGVGVTFKLAQAVAAYYQMNCINKYLDLVVLGTCSKHVDSVGENKSIIENGLIRLMSTHNFGLKALMKVYKVSNNLTSVIKFVNDIIEDFNETKRVDTARIFVELFTTNDKDRAEQIAKYLKKLTDK